MFGNCLKYVVLFLVSDLPVLLHHVWLLITVLYLPLYPVQLLIAVLDVLIYLVLPCRFTDILNFCIAYAFCPSIPEHKIQRECFSGPLPPTQWQQQLSRHDVSSTHILYATENCEGISIQPKTKHFWPFVLGHGNFYLNTKHLSKVTPNFYWISIFNKTR